MDPRCKGCGKCRKNCPMEAITGAAKQVHVIDPEKCINCGACVTNCPFGAIAASK
nr:4Fe-4S binding protein [Oscillibacter sp.]